MSTIGVYYEHLTIGEMILAETGPSFRYQESWIDRKGAFPISTRMPLGNETYGAGILLPWLANLLPENVHQLRMIARIHGVAAEDVVGLLRHVGKDTAGALTIGEAVSKDRASYREIPTGEDLERIIDDLPRKPFLAGEEGTSMSLAGAQDKLPVHVSENGRFSIPLDGAPSTHILKPDAERLWGSVQNEAFCLSLARNTGLNVSAATTGTAGARSFLLVERYDRRRVDGAWRRVHQEDFCQALGKGPWAKYERNSSGERGPTLKAMFDVAAEHLDPAARPALLDAVIFNVLIGNTDSHAKNYSLIFHGQRAPSLAPLYDLLSAYPYANVTRNLPQLVGGKNRGDHIMGRHWRRFAEECGLNRRFVLQRVEQMSGKILDHLNDSIRDVEGSPAGGHAVLSQVSDAIEARCRRVAEHLDDGDQDHSGTLGDATAARTTDK